MPKERSKRSTSHNSSVKLPSARHSFPEDTPIEKPASQTHTEEVSASSPPILKKRGKQLKREAFLRRHEMTQSPYSKSHQRRLKRKAKEQIGHGLEDIRDALQSVYPDKATTVQDSAVPATPEKSKSMQIQVNGKEDGSRLASNVKPSQIGQGKGATLSSAQRKKVLKTERLRHPLILSNPQFSSNPFETIRTHAQNTLVKHISS